jgi:hypothetical protein
MSVAPLGWYHFLAWARRGIAASIANPDAGTLPSRAALAVQLTLSVEQDGASRTVQPPATPVEVFGPGDVIGLDPRQVIRTEPRDGTVSFEPNYLCGIEFDAPDLPWAFTPAAPAGPGQERLRPWLALIALEPEEFALPSIAPLPLPAIDVLRIAALPDLADSWNWAHAQVSGDVPLAAALASAPGSAIARLLCPRRLDPETSYTAFLVPAFEIGRRAGLGQDVSALATADPAWTAGTPGTTGTTAPLRLPYYYRFDFHTSDAGDFESLVRRLAPTVLPDGVGQRPLDVSAPAPHVASAGPPLGLAGALHGLGTQPTPWNDPAKAAFQADVQAFINRPAAAQDDPQHPNAADPVVVPPIYGRWHAAVQSVDRTAPGWVNDLNLDPRDRAAAGMGTQVVQEERTALLAAAWQQVDGVRQANDLLRRAQLARAALQQVQRRRLLPALPETVVALTAPLHAKVLASPGTVLAMVRASRVPERMLSGTFRRVTRLRRRLGPAPAARPALLTRVASGDVAPVPPPQPPQGLVSLESLARSSAPATAPPPLLPLPASFSPLSVHATAAVPPNPDFAVAAAGVAAPAAPAEVAAAEAAPAGVAATGEAPLAVAATGAAPAAGTVAPAAATAAAAASKAEDSAQAAAFRTASANLFAAFAATAADPPPAPVLDLAALKTTLMTRLDPATTVPRRVRSLLAFAPGFSWAAADPLEPIMAAPTFPQPMYAPLRDLSAAGLLPGAELVPPDSVGLLLADQRFLEGYMVGLNHEMARQLLWSGYPTDQRGSYFRQFWDVSGYVPQPGDPTDPGQLRDRLADIPPIHTWAKPLALGGHPNRPGAAGDIVLLVRGELFKRYPNAIVYAGKAKLEGADRVLDDTDERYPVFRGTLPGDMTFLGFDLSADDARGGTAASPEGFFFIFQEQPAEPRFGLEPAEDASPITTWADLAWTNFGGGGAFRLPNLGLTARALTIANSPWRLASQVFSQVLAGTALPDFLAPGLAPARVAIAAGADNPEDAANGWGVDSAQTAAILLRMPFRILIHAGLMLPPSA